MNEVKDFSVKVINERSLDLETNSFFKKTLNIILVPALNSLPKGFKNLIKKTSNSAAVVIDNATTHKALEVLYSKGDLFSIDKLLAKFFKSVWFNLSNSKAVRNRLKLVKYELSLYLREQIQNGNKTLNIISIAAGSSRAIIEVVKSDEFNKQASISLTFLDKSEHAIEYSKKLSVHISHLPIMMTWVQDTVGSYLEKNKDIDNKFDVVEIVGLLDYFDNEKVVKTFKGIHQILNKDGIVITSNINHNSEEKFITKVIDWPMVYRTADELASLVNEAGFAMDGIKAFYEPLKIHGLVVARK